MKCVWGRVSLHTSARTQQSVWALDYLGASQDCVIAEMTAQVELFDYRDSIGNLDRGWFLCPSVIMPDADTLSYDTRLNAEEMAQRCRSVLPEDHVDLLVIAANGVDVERIAVGDCDAWGVWVIQGYPILVRAAGRFLASEWLEHHYGAPYDHEAAWAG